MVSIFKDINIWMRSFHLEVDGAFYWDNLVPITMNNTNFRAGLDQNCEVAIQDCCSTTYHIMHGMPTWMMGVSGQIHRREMEIPGGGKERQVQNNWS